MGKYANNSVCPQQSAGDSSLCEAGWGLEVCPHERWVQTGGLDPALQNQSSYLEEPPPG